jgi:hypothetical protein
MLAARGGGERETGRGQDAVVGQRESRARLTGEACARPRVSPGVIVNLGGFEVV